MNNVIAFFVGSITFALVMILKFPIKRFIKLEMDKTNLDYEKKRLYRKRLNTIIFFLVFFIAVVTYYFVLQWLHDDHFKWCCSLKAGTIAIAIYALFEQWFGEDSSREKSEKMDDNGDEFD